MLIKVKAYACQARRFIRALPLRGEATTSTTSTTPQKSRTARGYNQNANTDGHAGSRPDGSKPGKPSNKPPTMSKARPPAPAEEMERRLMRPPGPGPQPVRQQSGRRGGLRLGECRLMNDLNKASEVLTAEHSIYDKIPAAMQINHGMDIMELFAGEAKISELAPPISFERYSPWTSCTTLIWLAPKDNDSASRPSTSSSLWWQGSPAPNSPSSTKPRLRWT